MGNCISKTDMDGKVESYASDNTYRLTEARYADGSREAFTYDPVGNRQTRTDEAGVQIVYSYDIANQLLRAGSDTFVYDANGSVTSKTTLHGTTNLVYDGQNRVTSIAGPDGNETSVWGPDGQRVRMNNNASWSYGDTRSLYDLRGNAVLGLESYVIYRVFGPGVDELLAENKNTGHNYYYHHDALGSITAVTNDSGTVNYRRSYRAFGQMIETIYDTEHRTRYAYTGRELSVGTMMQYRSRSYDEAYGRFTQQDEYAGNIDSPPSLHRYVYTINSPIDYVDPNGSDAMELALQYPQGALIAQLMLGALGAAFTVFVSQAVIPLLIAIAVVGIAAIAGSAIYLVILKALEFIAEARRIDTEVRLTVKVLGARAAEAARLRLSRYRIRRPNGISDACALAFATFMQTFQTEGWVSLRTQAAFYVAVAFCAADLNPWGGSPAPPTMGGGGPSGIPE